MLSVELNMQTIRAKNLSYQYQRRDMFKDFHFGISRTADLEYLKKQNAVTDKSLLISLHIFFFADVYLF